MSDEKAREVADQIYDKCFNPFANEFDSERCEALISSALRAARSEALEEAAKVAGDTSSAWYNGEATTPYGHAYQAGCHECVAAIRALKDKP